MNAPLAKPSPICRTMFYREVLLRNLPTLAVLDGKPISAVGSCDPSLSASSPSRSDSSEEEECRDTVPPSREFPIPLAAA